MALQLERAETRHRILTLVRNGASPHQIVELLAAGDAQHGIPPIEVTTGEVSRLVKTYLDRVHTEDALTIEQLRVLENERLDAVWRALAAEMRNQDGSVNLKIVDRMTRLSERRSKMNGFEAAQKHEHFIGNPLQQLGLEKEHIERAKQAWLESGAIDGEAEEVSDA